jgi:hypothetical protein
MHPNQRRVNTHTNGRKVAEVGCLRVIDESGEDYLYPASRFVQVTFPADVWERLLATVGKERQRISVRAHV